MRPCRAICAPTSNCCATIAAMPFSSGRRIAERILVPATPSAAARSSRASSPGIGFIRVTPSASASIPLSTLTRGTTPRSSHR